MQRKSKIILCAVTALLIAAAMFALYQVWSELRQRKQEQDDFHALAEMTELPNEEVADDADIVPHHDVWELWSMNPDCVGWLSIPDTVVDYPVMQNADEPQKYLHRDFNGNYSYAGVPFLDRRCMPESHNWIIYGHNMNDGTMFGCLKRYLEDGFLAEHPVMYYETKDGIAAYEIIAIATVSKNDSWYQFLRRATAEDYAAGIQELLGKAQITTGVCPDFGDALLTLSTCQGGNRDSRLLVVGVRQP